MASVLVALWPGILGAVMTGFLIYLSLRGVGPHSHLTGLQWRAELDEPHRQDGT
jgi:hypothetical protein